MSTKYNIAGLILTLFIPIQIIGYVTNVNQLTIFGAATQLAPLQRPFHDIHGYEYFTSARTLLFYDKDEAKLEIKDQIAYNLVQSIKGPHKRKITFLAPISHLPILNKTPMTKSILNYALCTDNVFKQLNTFRKTKTDHITVITDVRTRGREWQKYTQDIHCNDRYKK